MRASKISFVIAIAMGVTAVAGFTIRPGAKAAQLGTGIVLEDAVPKSFGEWRLVPGQTTQVVNPQTKELLDKIYSQILSRTYVNGEGYRIMLSLAYGDDQRGGLQAHRPEVCYPAQGFKVEKTQEGRLATAFGAIEVRRLDTRLGQRTEPVTYWLTVGDQVIRNNLDRRIMEIRLGLTGQIPDGLLFRISSIDADPARAYAMQQKFTADMMAAVPAESRRQLSGLSTPASAS